MARPKILFGRHFFVRKLFSRNMFWSKHFSTKKQFAVRIAGPLAKYSDGPLNGRSKIVVAVRPRRQDGGQPRLHGRRRPGERYRVAESAGNTLSNTTWAGRRAYMPVTSPTAENENTPYSHVKRASSTARSRASRWTRATCSTSHWIVLAGGGGRRHTYEHRPTSQAMGYRHGKIVHGAWPWEV